jgi:hypothetical protein
VIPEADARKAIDLAGQGQNVSEIARRLGHDRKTIRIYLNGHRAPGQPRPHADSFAPFAAYVRLRAADDRHLRGAGLHREITALGYAGSYSAFTRELRGHGITAACGTCRKWKTVAYAPAPERRPGPLPFQTAPLAGETIASYLARAAAASSLPPDAIAGCLPAWFAARAAACDDLAAVGPPQPADIGHLAALTGTSETVLRQALPALAGGERPPVRAAFACRRCAAAAGQHSPVPVHVPAHRRTCPGHRTWLGRTIQIDTTAAPDIAAASRKASRLAREHGVTRLVLAETTARQDVTGGPEAGRRARALALATPGVDPEHPDTAEAAAYPETIKVAAALLRTPGALPGGPE